MVASPALLILEDGSRFRGESIGVPGQVVGEAVFNTAMTGYQEILTDPSYCRQIITLTYPHIGNVGSNPEDAEATGVHARRLGVLGVAAHVTDVGIGERDDLPAIGRIGEDFLIARHGGVENRLANHLSRHANGFAPKPAAVLQNQKGRTRHHDPLSGPHMQKDGSACKVAPVSWKILR